MHKDEFSHGHGHGAVYLEGEVSLELRQKAKMSPAFGSSFVQLSFTLQCVIFLWLLQDCLFFWRGRGGFRYWTAKLPGMIFCVFALLGTDSFLEFINYTFYKI